MKWTVTRIDPNDIKKCRWRDLEYRKVVYQSSDAEALIKTHRQHIDQLKAILLIAEIVRRYEIPVPSIRFTNKRGVCGKKRVSFPSNGRLRVGLVLHEMAHFIDFQRRQRSDHGPTFTRILDRLVSEYNKGATTE